jgi:AraC-like DNA-binding protein/mannose-6-phosphate isomerase-like protein (cupin superfamily)
MSQARHVPKLTREQEPFLVLRSTALGFASGDFTLLEHEHTWRQLLYAISGAMTVHAGRGSWMIPTGKAVLIPQGCRHSIRMWGEVAMRTLYLPPDQHAEALAAPECRVLSVAPLLRELILRVVEMGALDRRVPEQERLAGVVLDEIARAEVTPLALPVPGDERAAAVAQDVLASPATDVALDQLARRHGVGRRTLERLFRAETGMSFGMWQQKARLLYSVRSLAESRPVTEAALDAGYSSVSAYIAAFKKTFGCTPGRL